jgi:hypothetical protein
MQSIEVAYASASVEDVPIHALELTDKVAVANGDDHAVIRICSGFFDEVNNDGEEGITLGLEDGSQAFFISSGLQLALPPKSVKGKQNLTFQIDNVTGIARMFIDRALKYGTKVTLTHRVYLANYPSAPAKPRLDMTVSSCKTNIKTAAIVASFHDTVNRAWPRRRYTPTITPGLKYINT